MGYDFKGTWEELISDPQRFAGLVVSVDVQSGKAGLASSNGRLSFEEWKIRFDESTAVIDSLKGKIGPVPEGATSTESLYD